MIYASVVAWTCGRRGMNTPRFLVWTSEEGIDYTRGTNGAFVYPGLSIFVEFQRVERPRPMFKNMALQQPTPSHARVKHQTTARAHASFACVNTSYTCVCNNTYFLEWLALRGVYKALSRIVFEWDHSGRKFRFWMHLNRKDLLLTTAQEPLIRKRVDVY